MFLLEFDPDDVKKEASKLLKSVGVKHRLKKFEIKVDKKETNVVFKTQLGKLLQKKVKLPQYDVPVSVPGVLVDICNFLRSKLDTEGLFRKAGVACRQKELKQLLMSGGKLDLECEHNVSDVGDLLKQFFRELPEPCLPYAFHDTLQRCLEAKVQHKDAVLLTLLLLPLDHLFTLAYLMQFLREVAAHQQWNRMDVCNLAIVWTPNLMPFKTGQVNDKVVIGKRVAIIQMLIEHSEHIGVVPECLYEHLSSWTPSCSISSHDDLDLSHTREKKKKRRSGSLTRMLTGIKRMVRRSSSTEPQEQITPPQQASSACYTHTPRIVSAKKRKAPEPGLSFSAKKRRDVLDSLPQKSLLPDVCTATYLTPRVLVAQPLRKEDQGGAEEVEPKRRSRFYTCRVRTPEREKERKLCRSLTGTKLRLSHFGLRKHKKKSAMEDSGLELTATPDTLDVTSDSEDYVRISRSAYEDIESRVSKIESRISSEFENIIGVSMSDLEMTPEKPSVNNLRTVQSAYEQTLQSAEKLNCPNSEELARRFSRELKIRGNSSGKTIRSPSARKIGSLRRRSRENVPQVKRNFSLNLHDRVGLLARQQFYPTKSLRRGKPNTVSSGLPEPLLTMLDNSLGQSTRNTTNQLKLDSFDLHSTEPTDFDLTSFGVLTRSQARRASSSFHGCDLSKGTTVVSQATTDPRVDDIDWKTAEAFLDEEKTDEKPVTGRPSVAKIRSQNAGMVLQKAKLFNTLVDSDDRGHNRAFKNVCSGDPKPQESAKRNTSKSSKDKKPLKADIQYKDHQNKKSTGLCDSPASLKHKKENQNLRYGKENFKSSSAQQMPTSQTRTPLKSKNASHPAFTPGKLTTRVASPMKDRRLNSYYSPQARQVLTTRSPNVTRVINRNTASPLRSHYGTPRRSPRHNLLRSRHLSKQL